MSNTPPVATGSTVSTLIPATPNSVIGAVENAVEGAVTKGKAAIESLLSHLTPADQQSVSQIISTVGNDVKQDASTAVAQVLPVLTGRESLSAGLGQVSSAVLTQVSQVGSTAEATLRQDIVDAIDSYVESKGGAIGTDLVPTLNSGMTTAVNTLETYVGALAKNIKL